MTRSSLAHDELSRALALKGAARIEALVKLSQREPDFAPVWAALAEEHWRHRRNEEAVQAARRAMRLDPSIHRKFSDELARASQPILLELKGASSEQPAAPSEPARAPKAPQSPPPRRSREPADKDLERAVALVGYRRREKLEELSRTHPDHGPIWLALAEEHFAQRNSHQAMRALDNALRLDPSLEDAMSTELERIWQLSRTVRPSSHSAPAPSAAPAPAADDRAAHKPPEPAKPADNRAQVERHEQELVHAHVSRMLDTALTLRDRADRISVLENLLDMAPDHPEVLFNLAKELALAERGEEAREVGNALQRVAPDRYAELFAWAEEHWSKSKSESPLTRVLSALGSDARGAVEDNAPERAPGQRMLTSAAGELLAPEVNEDEPTNVVSRPPEPPGHIAEPDDDSITVKADLRDFGPPPSMDDDEVTVKADVDALKSSDRDEATTLRMQTPAAPDAPDRDDDLKNKAIKFFRSGTFDEEPPPEPAQSPAAQPAPKRKYAINKHVIRKPRKKSDSSPPPRTSSRKPDDSR